MFREIESCLFRIPTEPLALVSKVHIHLAVPCILNVYTLVKRVPDPARGELMFRDQSALLTPMKSNMLVCATLFAVSGLSTPAAAFADDSAASIAAGGLVARRETRIVMAKEVLEISPTKVIVEYDFRNDTDEDVTTEVAFPIPPYEHADPDSPAISDMSFVSFRPRIRRRRESTRTSFPMRPPLQSCLIKA
jgi:hypothetical protein